MNTAALMRFDEPQLDRHARRPAAWFRWTVFLIASLVALATMTLLVLPPVRDRALSDQRRGFAGNVAGHNLYFVWTDHFGKGGFRALMYPFFVEPAWDVQSFTRQNVNHPVGGHARLGEIYYGGKRITYPPGKDTALVAPDGEMSFMTLAPKYLKYGPVQTAKSGIFIARKRFPIDGVYDNGLNFKALEEDGLLPAWTKLRENPEAAGMEHPWEAARAIPTSPGPDPLSVSYSYALPRSSLVNWLVPIVLLTPLPFLLKCLKHGNRVRRGLCEKCGYDLRAGHHRCPECGSGTKQR